MNAYLLSLIWAMIQITLGLSVSLCTVWILRGRRPQLATAILSGTCVSSGLLLILVVLPHHQWSLVQSIGNLHDSSARIAAHSEDKSAGIDALPAVRPSPSPLPPATTSGRLDSSENTRWSGLEWLSLHLFQLDEHLRQVSRQNADRLRLGVVPWIGTFLMLFAIGVWLVGWYHARGIAQHCIEVDADSLPSAYRHLSTRLGISLPPRVYTSPRISVGATMGWIRPIIILNPDYRDWRPAQTAAVLAHELAHAARRDYAWVLIGSFARLLLWFHPLIHIAVSRLRFEQELAADQIAASSLGAKAYGRALAELTLANQISLRTPSPMLAAGQICVTRRILMLKQGRLKPQFLKRRWAASLTLLAIATALPLSGLRGQTDTHSTDPVSAAIEVGDKTPRPDFPNREEQLAALAKLPPFLANGTMVYRQSRMNGDQIGAENAWFANFLQVATMGRGLPNDCTLYGHAGIKLQWLDLQKETASLSTEGTICTGENTIAGDLSKMLSAPFISYLVPTSNTRTVLGRTAQAHTARGRQDEKPVCWVIDDAQGYHRAKTIEDLKAEMSGTPIRSAAIPAEFQADFDAAAAAVVFSDCSQLREQFQEFANGSSKSELKFVDQILGGINSLGVFWMPDGGELEIRAIYVDSDAAARVKTIVRGLLAAISVDDTSLDPDQQILKLISAIEISEDDNQLSFSLDAKIYGKLAATELGGENSLAPGWLANQDLKASQDGDGLELPHTGLGLIPNYVHQSVRAEPYRGRRLKLTADVGFHEGFEGHGGIVAWVNDSSDAPISFASQAGDGKSNLPSLFAAGHTQDRGPAEDETSINWRQVSIHLDVPPQADHLSFGAYCQRANIQIREFTIEDAGPCQSQNHEPPGILSALNIPGRLILKNPTNLSFHPTSDSQAEAQVAELKPAASLQPSAQRK